MSLVNAFLFLVVFMIAAYFVGNINFAILISKLNKKDIRQCGSGNPGTMNMVRNFGVKIGGLTLLLDVLKSAVPTAIAMIFFRNIVFYGFEFADLAGCLVGLAATLGHIFPVVYKFKGGKGIATTIGLFLALSPLSTLLAFVLGVLFIFIFKLGSLGSIMMISLMGVYQGTIYLRKYTENGLLNSPEISRFYIFLSLIIFLICATCWITHRKNISNLIWGREHQTNLRKVFKKKK